VSHDLAVCRHSLVLGALTPTAVRVLVLGLFVAGCGGHAHTHGTIVFMTVDGSRVAFYGVRPDGTGLVRLPPGTAPYGTSVAWSPDGAELEDAAGDLVLYVAGAAIHVLRLSDGRDVVIHTPDATEPVFARLVSNGFFYAFNVAYAKRPGRLVFVTRADLDRAR
jgi:hypothetical protein